MYFDKHVCNEIYEQKIILDFSVHVRRLHDWNADRPSAASEKLHAFRFCAANILDGTGDYRFFSEHIGTRFIFINKTTAGI